MPYPGPPLVSNNSCRVLYLQPGELSDPIHFSLELQNLSQEEPHPNYEALSYAWGDRTLTKTVICEKDCTDDSVTLSVTTNCYNAMMRLRLPDRVRILWIDAICINQEDISERNAQLRLMRKIYNGARQVIVYLGESDEGTDSVMHWLQDVYEPIKYPQEIIEFPPPMEEAWKSFMARPYFQRTWVLQEITNAQNVELQCGEKSIPWKALEACERYSMRRDSSRALPLAASVAIRIIRFLEREKEASPGVKLRKLLQLSRRSLSSDPRDKVYGVIPLLTTTEARDFAEPDYSLSTLDVFSRYASYLYEECGPEILREASTVSSGTSIELLPSWVPDWTQPIQDRTAPGWKMKPSNADGIPARNTKPQCGVSIDMYQSPRLHIRGICIGSTKVLSAPCDVEQNVFPLSQWQLMIQYCPTLKIDLSDSSTPAPDAVSRTTAFHRLLTDDAVIYPEAIRRGINYINDWEREKLSTMPLQECFKSLPPSYQRQVQAILDTCDQRKLVILDNGLMGLVPTGTVESDVVFVIPGASVPFVFRPENNCYKLVGECYVQGIMYGEACSEVSTSIELLTVE